MDIKIRRAEPSDYEAMAESLGDPMVYPGTLQLPHPSREMWRKRLAEFPDSDVLLLAEVGGKVVGHAGLHAVGGWLNVFRIELNVFAENERAIALYRRFGFEIEGKHRAYALRDGHYVDSISMARLKPKPPGV